MDTFDIEELVNLKFTIDKNINECKLLLSNINSNKLITTIDNLDFYDKIILYIYNCKKGINDLLKIQNNMIEKIDNILLNQCSHCWIDDVIEEALEREHAICYCNKCFIYKKK